MVTHVVLFRPRPDLTETQRHTLGDALKVALREIPHVRRAWVGHRVFTGRPYERLMRTDFPYMALLEFDDEESLRAYFTHPAHDDLGARFFEVFEEALMYDYDLGEGDEAIDAVVQRRSE